LEPFAQYGHFENGVQERNMAADKPIVPNGTFPDPKERTPTLLIVEDEVLIRMALSDYLQDCGYKVLEASAAEEAVLIIDQGDIIIDVVFSDLKLPGPMDGFGLAQWLRANRPGTPIFSHQATRRKHQPLRNYVKTNPS
jgi:CheY-like chemotaxis protein